MMNKMASLIFLHGLNTYGDDDIHIGPWKFAAMHTFWQKALERRGVEFHALTGLSPLAPRDQAQEALALVRARRPSEPLHLLGQSTGGLTARALAAHPELRGRVASVMTIGTPNSGASAAELGLEFARSSPAWHRLFSLFGYDTVQKTAIYRHFTPAAVREFNSSCALPSEVRALSFICEVGTSELSWPLRFLHGRINPEGAPGDGFIPSDSQRFGDCQGPYRLDHFGELGFFPYLRPSARLKTALEFERLADAVAKVAGNRGP